MSLSDVLGELEKCMTTEITKKYAPTSTEKETKPVEEVTENATIKESETSSNNR